LQPSRFKNLTEDRAHIYKWNCHHGFHNVVLSILLPVCYILERSMCATFLRRKLLLAAALVCMAPFLSAQDGLKGALFQANFGTPVGYHLAAADLDGDDQADGAILLDSKWIGDHNNIKIQLHFTGRPNTELSLESTGQALTVRASDIDRDGDNDLVVEDAFTHKPLHVWINEGHGDFHEGNIQDYPSLALEADKQLQSPCNQPDCVLFWVPPQRGFEVSMITVHLLGRPPSTGKSLDPSISSSLMSRIRASRSSRAPPLLS
jgi:hypothetical protein